MSQPGRTPLPRRFGRRGGRGVVLGAVCLVLALVGCGRQQAATISTTPVPVTSSTATPATSAAPSIFAAPTDAYVKPVKPPSLDGPPSEDAAIDFAKYYLRMYTYAYLTGDASDLNALGRTGCVFCANVAADISREYGAGGHDEGGAISIDAVRAVDYDVDGFYVVTMDAQQAPNREVNSAGAPVTINDQAKQGRYQFATYWTRDGGWQLAELSVSAA